jgi:hypothetical protein
MERHLYALVSPHCDAVRSRVGSDIRRSTAELSPSREVHDVVRVWLASVVVDEHSALAGSHGWIDACGPGPGQPGTRNQLVGHRHAQRLEIVPTGRQRHIAGAVTSGGLRRKLMDLPAGSPTRTNEDRPRKGVPHLHWAVFAKWNEAERNEHDASLR